MAKIKIGNREFEENDPNLIKDYITGEYIHPSYSNAIRIITDLQISRPRISSKAYDRNSESSYDLYKSATNYVLHNNYIDLLNNLDRYNNLCFSFILTSWGDGFVLSKTKEERDEKIKKYGFVPGINNPDIYFDPHELAAMDRPKPYRKFDNTYSKVSIEDIITKDKLSTVKNDVDVMETKKNIMKRNILMGVESLTFKELEGLKYTFGVELETCCGHLSEEEVADLNVKAVHDGSLREPDGSNPIGGEYVTGVLVGDSGLTQLHDICRVLQTKCAVDKRCGVHTHIGSLNWNKEDIVYSFLLAEILEKELFSILPESRRSNSYCRPLNRFVTKQLSELISIKGSEEYNIKVNEIYNLIFSYVSGMPPSEGSSSRVNRNSNHPKGSKCGYDKAAQRYCWLNYVTLMFDTKGCPNSHTLEFRPMSGTLNYTKVKNWLKICMAFCAFVDNHKALIKNCLSVPVTLETVINKVYPKTGDKLISYIRERKQIFKTADESIDYAVDTKIAKQTIKEVACAYSV